MRAKFQQRIYFAFLAIMAVLGTALFFYGRSLAPYIDADQARELKGLNACGANGPVDGWYNDLAALETLRYPLMQGGLSLILASITIAILLKIFAVDGGYQLRTPNSRLPFFGLGVGVIGLSWFAQMLSFVVDQGRGNFPWCADSIFIGMMQVSFAYVFLLVVALIVGGLLSLRFARLPVRLIAWRSEEKAKSVMISLPFAFIGIVVVLLGFDSAINSSFLSIPAEIVALYLIESTRSALLAREDAVSEA